MHVFNLTATKPDRWKNDAYGNSRTQDKKIVIDDIYV